MDDYKKNSVARNLVNNKVLTVNFTCQRCCQPLRIHKTFSSIDQNGLNTFIQLNFDDDDDEELKNELEGYKNFPYLMESGLNINDFLLVEGGTGANAETTTNTDSSSRNSNISNSAKQSRQQASARKTSTLKFPADDLNFKVTSKLFEVLSDQSIVNHPLCEGKK